VARGRRGGAGSHSSAVGGADVSHGSGAPSVTGPEIVVLLLALALMGVVAFLPAEQVRFGAILTTLSLMAAALVVFHQWTR
jgi:hypothetical protein